MDMSTIIEAQVAALTEQTEQAKLASENVEAAEAFKYIRDLASFGAPEQVTEWLDLGSLTFGAALNREEGDKASAFLTGALGILPGDTDAALIEQVNGAISAWQASAPKVKGTRKAKGEGTKPAQPRDYHCSICDHTYTDSTDANSARWQAQKHCEAKHGWTRKYAKPEADWQRLTDAMNNGGHCTLSAPEGKGETVTFKVTLPVEPTVEATEASETEAAA